MSSIDLLSHHLSGLKSTLLRRNIFEGRLRHPVGICDIRLKEEAVVLLRALAAKESDNEPVQIRDIRESRAQMQRSRCNT